MNSRASAPNYQGIIASNGGSDTVGFISMYRYVNAYHLVWQYATGSSSPQLLFNNFFPAQDNQ